VELLGKEFDGHGVYVDVNAVDDAVHKAVLAARSETYSTSKRINYYRKTYSTSATGIN
jgi:hypothetical protein